MQKFYSELLGTFLFTVFVGLSGNPLGTGLLLACMVYLASGISGSHFNPAISLAAWLTGHINTRFLGVYLLAQISGAFPGAAFVWWLSGSTYSPSPGQLIGVSGFIILEILFSTLFFVLFLCVMYPGEGKKNPAFGFIIGLGLAGCYMITEPLAGTGLHPFMNLAFSLLDLLNNGYSWQHLPVYFFAPGIGALAAAFLYRRMIFASGKHS